MSHINLDEIKLLGQGGFAQVHLKRDKFTKKEYAVKIINTSNLDLKTKHLMAKEIIILKKLEEHPNIIKFYDSILTENGVELILEYCNGGTLKKYLLKYNKAFPPDIVRHIAKQILQGLDHLHKNDIIHRDIKLDNILLHFQDKNDLNSNDINKLYKAQIKIIDFNVSKNIGLNHSLPYTIIGTSGYMAPEIIQNLFYGIQNPYDKKVDIWSLGVLCYKLLYFQRPFNSPYETLKKNPNFTDLIPSNARNFLSSMLQRNPVQRPAASELLNCEFIKNENFILYYNDNQVYNNINYNYNNNTVYHQNNIYDYNYYQNSDDYLQTEIYSKGNENFKNNVLNKTKIINLNKPYNDYFDQNNNIIHNNTVYMNNNHINPILQNSNVFYSTYEPLYIINVIFKSDKKNIVVIAYSNVSIEKIIKNYFLKIDRLDLINNIYNTNFRFVCGLQNLLTLKKIGDIARGRSVCMVNVMG